MSYQDISREIEELYAFSVSTATISAVTDKVIPELKLWQQRPLEKVYPFVWLDAIHYKIREDGRYQSKAVYTVLALNLEGQKGSSGPVSVGKRRGELLAVGIKRPAKPWRGRYPDRLRGRADRLPGGDKQYLSADRSSVVHHSPDTQPD
ncbi:Transposase for insertion sequence element ISRM3 [Salmonella enterica subsp. enterica serovar Sanjuan]|uniref:Mutator family transposase n=1 Tax=Salmonella enterica subsp. enterica serovar Sanjuan TaxID=1160765 RepID=A0A447NS30_SALET|nr:Transposase for insertion sequence element ISRM3 [Salmonella enterica subsp. enterica serovar Sanjuan]